MNNYWLDRKKPCNKKWKRIEMGSGYGHSFIMKDFTCSTQEGKISTKMSGEKSKEMLEMIETKLE